MADCFWNQPGLGVPYLVEPANDPSPYYRYDWKIDISVNYEGKLKNATTEKFVNKYTNNVVVDSLTSGNWVGKYGKNGYLLCDFDGKNEHRTKLSDFMEKMDVKSSDIFRFFGSGISSVTDSNTTALVSDFPNEKKRSVCISNAITTTVEISFKTQKEYKVSLYIADWKNENLSSVLEVFDLNSNEILMPYYYYYYYYYFANYQHGEYLTLTFNQSVRIRIQRIRGENTSLGGVFFD